MSKFTTYYLILLSAPGERTVVYSENKKPVYFTDQSIAQQQVAQLLNTGHQHARIFETKGVTQ